MSAAQSAETLPCRVPSIDTPAGVQDVLERAARGEDAVMPLVRAIFDRDDGRGLLDAYADAYGRARRALTESAAGGNLAAREALGRRIDALRDELAGPGAPPLERILAERVALCWLDAHEADRRSHEAASAPRMTSEFRESRSDRAQKRFLAACKALASVRKLGAAAVQINVARQQVNVAGPTP